MNTIPDGTRIQLHGFGPASVRRLMTTRNPVELVCDVKTDAGEYLHLSIAYVYKLRADVVAAEVEQRRARERVVVTRGPL